jgi:hypothetical protein
MRRVVALLSLASLLFGSTWSPAATTSAHSCGTSAYAYAGFSAAHRSYGVAATLVPLRAPEVMNGHVAAWLGVGGPGAGSGGHDEWLQVGVSGFVGKATELYYELTLPGQAPQYTKIADVAPLERHRIALVELARRPSVWQIWVDSRVVGAPIYLPNSHGRWAPIATAESWNGGTAVCNSYAYRFAGVSSARRPGGDWRPFRRGYRFQDPGYRLQVWRSSFTARAQF